MKLLPLALLGINVMALAQSPMVCSPSTSGTGNGIYLFNTPPPAAQMFFDLNVLTQVTLQAIRTSLFSPTGQTGQFEVWMTNPGITTHVGNETTAANWTLVASGPIVSAGNGSATTACEAAIGGGGLVLNPGPRGIALRYTGVNPSLTSGLTGQVFTNNELSLSNGGLQYGTWGNLQGPTAAGNQW